MKNLVFYMTLHYPDRDGFFEILELLSQEGAGYVEIGMPVSEPYMDGDIIRQTHVDVLRKNITLEDVIYTLEEIKKRFSFSVVLMTYKEGVEYFHLNQVPKHLYDGFICVDGTYPPTILKNQITVLSHTMRHEELKRGMRDNLLFAYVVSGDGKTGSFSRLPTQYIEIIGRIKEFSQVPVFVGFGIKSGNDIKNVLKNGADGAIIGTEFIRQFQSGGIEALKTYLGELKGIDV